MKQNRISWTCRALTLAVVTLLWVAGSTAQADVTIYSDAFNRTGLLNLSSPDIASGLYGGSSNVTWTAPAGLTLTGTEAPFNGNALAYLPFTPQSGYVYALTVLAQDGSDWAGIGFTTTSTPSTSANLNNCESGSVGAPAWILYQSNVANLRYANNTAASSSASSGYNTVTLVLDTTGASWTEEGFFNGAWYGSHTYATTPVINTVALSAAYGGAGMNADSFSLTVNTAAVPEPSTWMLVGLAMIPLFFRRSRKSC